MSLTVMVEPLIGTHKHVAMEEAYVLVVRLGVGSVGMKFNDSDLRVYQSGTALEIPREGKCIHWMRLTDGRWESNEPR